MSEILKVLNKSVELKSEKVELSISDLKKAAAGYDKAAKILENAIKKKAQLFAEAKKQREEFKKEFDKLDVKAEAFNATKGSEIQNFQQKAKELGVDWRETKAWKDIIKPAQKNLDKWKEEFNSEISGSSQIRKIQW